MYTAIANAEMATIVIIGIVLEILWNASILLIQNDMVGMEFSPPSPSSVTKQRRFGEGLVRV